MMQLLVTLLTLGVISATPSTPSTSAFSVICIGAGGGPFQDSLSAYLIGVRNTSCSDSLPSRFGSFDVGTLLSGLKVADYDNLFSTITIPSTSQLTKIGYVLTLITQLFLSHAHMDHLVGMVIDSPVMGGAANQKGLVGLNSTLTAIQNYYFNNQAWPNMGNTGVSPLGQFRYNFITPGVPQNFSDLGMQVTAWPLVHASITSTTFLIYAPAHNKYMMYWGDVGPDSVQNVTNNRHVWQTVAPYVANGLLPAIIIECSYNNNQSDASLFGHLKPKYLMEELHVLASYVQAPARIRNLKVVVSHIKPSINMNDDRKAEIAFELTQLNDLGVQFLFPQVGDRFDF